MSYMPMISEGRTTRSITDTFAGYNHQLKIQDGEFYDTTNISTRYYPLLSNRDRRGHVRDFEKFQGIVSINNKLAWVDNGRLYFDGNPTPVKDLTDGPKQMLTTGAYICIWPDKAYYNTVDSKDYGRMESYFSIRGATISYAMCDVNGVEYPEAIISETTPETPAEGDLWIDSKYSQLKVYVSVQQTWVIIPNVYTKITFPALPVGGKLTDFFKVDDAVTISGTKHDELNATKYIYKLTDTYMVVVGILDNEHSQANANITISRTIPDMDYVIECQNRLWGCKYGTGDGNTLNEIYCCRLGDFKNWNVFQGISTDSYIASVGTDGPWTGAINYMGYPTFFKENFIHRVAVSATGAHQIASTPCRGVQNGSEKSLQVVNESLFYKSPEDICTYQGGFPTAISEKLGDIKYHDAVCGSKGDCLYICMKDPDGRPNLFVADVSKGLWIREDDLDVTDFTFCADELYGVSGNKLYALTGLAGTLEPAVEWSAESGILYYELPDKKYVSRFNLRIRMERDANFTVYLEYDSDGIWHENGHVRYSGTGTVNLPIRPRRCDHLRIKIAGKGDIRLFSIARILEQGSDI